MLPESNLSAAEILDQQITNTESENPQDNEVEVELKQTKRSNLYSM